MPRTRAHITVTGRVQGVFYRSFTLDAAQAQGLTGWVRNLRDGSVEAVIEGERGAVEVMIAQCGRGPHHARVDNIDTEWQEYLGEFDAFTIR